MDSLTEVVLQHSRALDLLYTEQGYCMTLGKLAVSMQTTQELSGII